ncbi:sensor histidine kinase [Sunxiuqinia indica]|uniref:sensor histidine kinase n=1 Tax=Sunxiuqinia indica TaxID=2692584 RepID=UPI0013587527|nr:HAMP domain-containing sensor histidine kinase [Sunxiuqinia indica]
MLDVNVKTLFLFLILGNLFIITFFLIYIRLYHSRIRKLNKYVLARSLQTVAWLIYFLQVRNLEPAAMSIGNTFLAVGVALEIYTLLTATQTFVKKKFTTLLIIGLIFSILYAIASNNINQRVIVASFFWFLFYAYVWIDFSLRNPRSKLQKAAGWLGFILSILFLNRAIHTFLLKIDLILHSPEYYNVLPGLGLFIVSIAWPLIFILLHKEQDELEILKKDDQIKRKNKQLKKLNVAKDRFFRIISHDLRAPISSMISFLDLIDEEIKNQDFSKIGYYNSLVSQSAKQSFALVDNLLNWSYLESGENKVETQPINLQELVNHIFLLFQLRLQEKDLQFINKIPSDFSLSTDQLMLETVLRNLISNAIKFTSSKGTITLDASKNHEKIRIEVQDTGIGISPENIDDLFKLETNYSSEGTNKEKGTGLGLVLCNDFVKRNKGNLEVKSEVGKGSVFSIHLPVI